MSSTPRRSHCTPSASRTLALVGPCASTVATWGSFTNASSTAGGVLRAEQDVEIADRLGPAPQAAADLGADHLRDGSRTASRIGATSRSASL